MTPEDREIAIIPAPVLVERAQRAAKGWLDRWNLRWNAEGGVVRMPPGSGSALAEVDLAMVIEKIATAFATDEAKQQVASSLAGRAVECPSCAAWADDVEAHRAREARLRGLLDTCPVNWLYEMEPEWCEKRRAALAEPEG